MNTEEKIKMIEESLRILKKAEKILDTVLRDWETTGSWRPDEINRAYNTLDDAMYELEEIVVDL